jgi:DNA repair exonuclease SbcCD ATPase subunit
VRHIYLTETTKRIFTFLIVPCLASLALADDFKTIEGKEYKNAKVSRVEPDGIVLITSSGISKVYFTELPKEVQETFHYDAEQAAAYSAQQNEAGEQYRKQQEEALRQKADATEKNNKYAGEQLEKLDKQQKQQKNIQALRARYQELQQKEDDLVARIGQAKREPVGSSRHPIIGSQRRELPSFRSELNDVRQEKNQVKQQIEQAQH